MLRCQLITQEGVLHPNIIMIFEIILVIEASSANAEQGFSTLRRNLQENRIYMSNERLNQILTVKINLSMLHNLIEDYNNVI